MELVAFLVVGAIFFGVIYLIDRGFTKIFRGQPQHDSGRSVRLNKRHGSIGIILFALGMASLFAGFPDDLLLGIGGAVVTALGIGLVVYYMTFGIFYDDSSFVLTTFGRRSTTYRYDQIAGQLLYNASGNILIELHMTDGRTVGLQAKMDGVYPFLDTAYIGWCCQLGKQPQECKFHDPANSLWFPIMEGK